LYLSSARAFGFVAQQQNLVHTKIVHVDDLDGIISARKRFALTRDVPEPLDDESPERFVVAFRSGFDREILRKRPA